MRKNAVFDTDAAPDERIGEVIEASTTRFVAQCPRLKLHAPPALGAFVKVLPAAERSGTAPSGSAAAPVAQDPFAEPDPFADPAPLSPTALPPETQEGTLYAIVCAATTGSVEPGRRPAAYGLDEETLRAEQPQIFDLLSTQFDALLIGFAEEGRVRSYLPPRPPRLHAFVSACRSEEIYALTETFDFLRPLLNAPGTVDPDERIAACLRQAYACRNRDFRFLVRVGKHLANLLRDNPERLAALLRKLEPAP